MRSCRKCKGPILPMRLEALPDTKVCVNCSGEKKRKGFMTWEHKTAPTFQLVSEAQHAILQRHSRKGVHASLPMSNKSVSKNSLGQPLQKQGSYKVLQSEVTSPSARCHPERQKVTPDGKCVECALEWYARRVKR